jgi:hypothetical protein
MPNINHFRLNDENILQIIHGYIKNASYKYAVLITGEWGTGKTYFVRNKLIPRLEKEENNKKVFYISLNGVASYDEILKQMFFQAVPIRINNQKIRKVTGILKDIFFIGASIRGYSNKGITVDYKNLISDMNNCIVIFDDLERCHMSIDTVLGQINNLVEHDGLKTIIIANESAIEKLSFVNSIERKLELASNKSIAIPEFDSKNKEERTDNDTYTINKLYDRAKAIFSEGQRYREIKEKLIGITIEYNPELEQIIRKLSECNNYCDITKKEIEKNIDYIVEKLEGTQHKNIRTLQFFLDSFNNIIIQLSGKIKEGYPEIYTEMFQFCLVAAIKQKKKNESLICTGTEEVVHFSASGDIFSIRDYIKGFKFIELYIMKSFLDVDSALSVINKEVEDNLRLRNVEDSPFNKLSDWKYLEDKEVESLIRSTNNDFAEKGENYPISTYPRLLLLYCNLESVGFKIADAKQISTIMRDRINDISYRINKHDFDVDYLFSDVSNQDERFKEMLKELQCAIQSNNRKYHNESLESIFNSDDWPTNLKKYVDENEYKFFYNVSIFQDVSVELIIDKIKGADNMTIANFIRIIGHIYRFSNSASIYPDDYTPIKEMIVRLELYASEIEKESITKLRIIKNLIASLKQVINLYPRDDNI